MLKIRLKRVGRKNNPSFRVVLVESQKGPQTGKIIENLGFYDPKDNSKKIDAERVKHWIANGAQPSDTMHNLLINEKIIEGKKINVLPQKSPVVKESAESEVKEAPVAEEEGTPTEEAKPEEKPAEETTEETTEEKPAEETTEPVEAPTSPEGESESQPAENEVGEETPEK